MLGPLETDIMQIIWQDERSTVKKAVSYTHLGMPARGQRAPQLLGVVADAARPGWVLRADQRDAKRRGGTS